jgi:hypothetical protein
VASILHNVVFVFHLEEPKSKSIDFRNESNTPIHGIIR